MAELGYYSGDTHLHLPRRDAADDERNLDLLAAEDAQYGFALAGANGLAVKLDRPSFWPRSACSLLFMA